MSTTLVVTTKLRLDLIPQLARDDGFVLSRMALPLVADLSKVNAVVQNLIEGAARVGGAAASSPAGPISHLTSDSFLVQAGLQFSNASSLKVDAEDPAHHLRLLRVYN